MNNEIGTVAFNYACSLLGAADMNLVRSLQTSKVNTIYVPSSARGGEDDE